MKIFQLTAIILLLTVCNTFAQPIDSLKQEIQKIISSKKKIFRRLVASD